ncbi:uncharacterized protein LOC141722140 [Apium graveolens]|uniref:uncharacterized protein LOC141722140 n=1 Tax=Apium graveolens TaxID=4045 RepID=UPI003D7C0222
MNLSRAGSSYEASRKKWSDFLQSRSQKTHLPKSLPLPKKQSIPAYKLSLTHKQSFRPLKDMIYAIEEEPRFCIHGVKGVTIDVQDGKMSVAVLCRENVKKRRNSDIKVHDMKLMDIYWPCLNRNFNTKEIFWQYQVDKYGGLTDLKDDHLSFGLRLGMRYIPKIADIFVAHGFKENKTYNCLRFVEMMEKDLEFTPEVIFKKLKKSKQLLYLDSLGVFVNRKDLKPMSYLIDRFFLANHWFRLESLATRLGCTPSDKKAKLDLEFN